MTIADGLALTANTKLEQRLLLGLSEDIPWSQYINYIPNWLVNHLFQNNEQGVWYDPSDLSTLFQDAAMTVPVTANGDPVGAMMDLSGNGNHATQTVSASRPTYKGLSYDGTDDALNTVINFPLGDFTISIAVDTALLNGRMAVLGNNDSSAISAIFLEANSIDDSVLFYFGDLGIAVPSIQNTGIRVLTITKLENTYSIYVDDVLGESKTVEKSLTLSLTKIGNWLNTRRFKGKIGGVVILNRAVTEIERTQLVDYLANSLEGSL